MSILNFFHEAIANGSKFELRSPGELPQLVIVHVRPKAHYGKMCPSARTVWLLVMQRHCVVL